MIPFFNNQEKILGGLVNALEKNILGVYLYGSLLRSQPRPLSDVDLLVIVKDAITDETRKTLVSQLLPLSAYPPAADGRQPLEVTVVAHSEIKPWRHPVTRDFIYGEWLRSSFERGEVRPAAPEPDLTLILAQARASHQKLLGQSLDELVPHIPISDIHLAIKDSLPALMSYLKGDERNVLLTLARMLVTLDTGAFVTKDEAVDQIQARFSSSQREFLCLARDAYLGKKNDGDWSEREVAVTALATDMEKMIRAALAK